jgi:CRISPR-associated protein Cas4
MEGKLVQISKINDFVFCPYSIYLHGIYESFDQKVYHDKPQTEGKINHENIEKGKYSSEKCLLQAMMTLSLEWGVIGKIDIFDTEKGELIERKTQIKKVYDGYRYQLYCQMLCLQEAGFIVNKLTIRSLKDNKRFRIELPNKEELNKLHWTLERMRSFNPSKINQKNLNKCVKCIYSNLCN